MKLQVSGSSSKELIEAAFVEELTKMIDHFPISDIRVGEDSVFFRYRERIYEFTVDVNVVDADGSPKRPDGILFDREE